MKNTHLLTLNYHKENDGEYRRVEGHCFANRFQYLMSFHFSKQAPFPLVVLVLSGIELKLIKMKKEFKI